MNATSSSAKERIVVGLCVVAVLWAIGCAVIYSEMRKPPEEFGRFMARIPGPVAFLAFPFETLWTPVSEAVLFDIGCADAIPPVLAVPEAHVADGTRAG